MVYDNVLAHASLRLVIGLVIAGASAELASAQALPDDADLKLFSAYIDRTPPQSWPGFVVYLGNGLILPQNTSPGTSRVQSPTKLSAGQDLPAALVKEGNFEDMDLTLLSIDLTKLPIRLQMRRMPLCTTPPFAGETVVISEVRHEV